MANPNWVKGCAPTNPGGPVRHRERFKQVEKKSNLQRKIGLYLTRKWSRMVTDMDSLNERDRVKAYLELMNYCEAKKAAISADTLTNDQVELLYQKITTLANAKVN
jgi:hypothetical protein